MIIGFFLVFYLEKMGSLLSNDGQKSKYAQNVYNSAGERVTMGKYIFLFAKLSQLYMILIDLYYLRFF